MWVFTVDWFVNGAVEMSSWEGIWCTEPNLLRLMEETKVQRVWNDFFLGHTAKISFGFYPVRNNPCRIMLWQCILALQILTFDV